MTFQQELRSWMSPTAIDTSPAPKVGTKAPTSSKLSLPYAQGKPTVVTFLRHCGCPFAEKTFRDLRDAANKNTDVDFVAVSHSDEQFTKKWLEDVGGQGQTKIVVDSERQLYGNWGLGVSSIFHVLNPKSLYALITLGKSEGIWKRPTESGSRWQTAGSFAVDGQGTVKWVNVYSRADEVPDFQKALAAVEAKA